MIWDRFSPLVRRVLRRTLGPNADVEGLVQSVFLRALAELGGLPDSAQLKPFMVAVTARVLSSELKRDRLRRLLRVRSPWSAPDWGAAPVDAARSTALSSLYRILDELDAEARLAFTLRHFEGLQIAELASAMDASPASVKRRLARANARVLAAVSGNAEFAAYAGTVGLGEAL